MLVFTEQSYKEDVFVACGNGVGAHEIKNGIPWVEDYSDVFLLLSRLND